MEYARERLGRKKDGTAKSPYQSGGQCLNAVANIAKAGGMNLKSAAKASDKINGTLLYTSMQQDGWVELGIGDPDAYPNKLPGDVVVEEATKTNTAGHIQIWDGKSWISDFVQNSTHVHSKGEGKKHYYRYGPLVASL